MKILVTGGAGFIGSNFIRYLLEAHPGSSVINLDKLTYAGNLQNLCEVEKDPNYQFVRGDICDSALIETVLDQSVDAVVHFAAESHVDRSIADAREFVRTNVEGTLALLMASRRKGIRRFLHVSTDEVYGSLAPGETSNEEASLRPNSPYAASKAAADLLVRSFCRTYGFPAIITRCSNNYGPYQFLEKLIPLMITRALQGEKLPVYGDGLNEREWIFVEDHCSALDQVLGRGRTGEVYNISSGQPTSNLQVVRALLRILERSEDLIDFVIDRPGHDRRYALDTFKIRGELGWTPAVSLEDGLRRTAEWYSTHQDWVEQARNGDYLAYYEKFYGDRRNALARL